MIRNVGIASGRDVVFRLRDVVCPEQERIFQRASTEMEVTGRIILISEGGYKFRLGRIHFEGSVKLVFFNHRGNI